MRLDELQNDHHQHDDHYDSYDELHYALTSPLAYPLGSRIQEKGPRPRRAPARSVVSDRG